MSEQTIKEELRNQIAALAEFENNSVVVDSWEFLDQPAAFGPFCRIETAGLIRYAYETVCPTYTWQIPIVLVDHFIEWDATTAGLGKLRTAVIAQLATMGFQTALGAGVDLLEVRDQNPEAPVGAVVDPAVFTEETAEAIPTYLALPLFVTIEERL